MTVGLVDGWPTLLVMAALALMAGATAANYGGKCAAMWWASGRVQWPAVVWPVAGLMVAGAAAAAMLATGLVAKLLAPWTAAAGALLPGDGLRALAAAAAVVAAASLRGWPVSTTHAVIGAMSGVLLLRLDAAPATAFVAQALPPLLVPLLLSPALAAAAAVLLRRLHPGSALVPERARPALHRSAAAALAFAAGFNTLPKVAALAIAAAGVAGADVAGVVSAGGADVGGGAGVAGAVGVAGVAAAAGAVMPPGNLPWPLVLLILLAMAVGARAARPVATRVGFGLAALDERRAAQAAWIAALFTVAGASTALPVSQTHLLCGAVWGAGLSHGWAVWRPVLMAWCVTAPVAALLAAALATLA